MQHSSMIPCTYIFQGGQANSTVASSSFANRNDSVYSVCNVEQCEHTLKVSIWRFGENNCLADGFFPHGFYL